MESNREEALKCLRLAQKFLSDGLFDKAEKFAHKSNRLYPTDKVEGSSFWVV